MDTNWFFTSSIFITTLIILLLHNYFKSGRHGKSNDSKTKQLPPGPSNLPIIDGLRWILRPHIEIESRLRSLRSKYGPVITLHIGSQPNIFIFSRTLAHKALIQNGAVFANRPQQFLTGKRMSANNMNISSAPYGPAWRLLRRNLTGEILNPSRVRSYSQSRRWVLDVLVEGLGSGKGRIIDHFHHAMFCQLAFMCFGDKLDGNQIDMIKTVHRRVMLSMHKFEILSSWPRLTKVFLRGRWNEYFQIRKDQAGVVVPMIRARKDLKARGTRDSRSQEHIVSYVDTLLELEMSEEGGEKRKPTEPEMVAMCSEFINAGTDTTSTSLQWIMANLVKYPAIQGKIVEEIETVVGKEAEEVTEDDLAKLSYLKAVVLEGLRRHPATHFLLPHAVTEDTELGGYSVPRNVIVKFMVADMGRDPEVWEEPMEFKPERFLDGREGEGFDITGSREIKMMPFGVGRRMCPGYVLAMLHLEYFLANLVLKFEWKAVDGDDIDLAEKQEFGTVMKYPLRAHISPRKNMC